MDRWTAPPLYLLGSSAVREAEAPPPPRLNSHWNLTSSVVLCVWLHFPRKEKASASEAALHCLPLKWC